MTGFIGLLNLRSLQFPGLKEYYLFEIGFYTNSIHYETTQCTAIQCAQLVVVEHFNL